MLNVLILALCVECGGGGGGGNSGGNSGGADSGNKNKYHHAYNGSLTAVPANGVVSATEGSKSSVGLDLNLNNACKWGRVGSHYLYGAASAEAGTDVWPHPTQYYPYPPYHHHHHHQTHQ